MRCAKGDGSVTDGATWIAHRGADARWDRNGVRLALVKIQLDIPQQIRIDLFGGTAKEIGCFLIWRNLAVQLRGVSKASTFVPALG